MKRPAICFCLCLSVFLGWAGTGNAKAAKNGGSSAGAPAPSADANSAAADPNAAPAPAADSNAAPAADPNAAPAADSNAAPAPDDSTVTPEGDESGLTLTPEAKPKAATTLSWQDIVVVPRKAFLKGGRVEFAPMTGVSINDNLIRHYAFGGAINYYLSDALSVGLEGQYYVKELTASEENIGLQYNRIPTLNRYKYSGALVFGYAPVYGKFAWFNKQIVSWEIFANAGAGVIATETVPRDAGLQPFDNNRIMVPVGIGSRFFLFNWLTVNFMLRDYLFTDLFEPKTRGTDPALADPTAAKNAADSAFVNNLMLYVGVGVYLPTKFSYRTPR
ncbi:MAG TPA: outer membrane beta-barrel domain-containing protein [Polyangia bacterium]|nr:outer membrane beta-barrel domain-containing protein [Polyangia bacterium]